MPLEPGTQLAARYDLLALLGEGGSARVFRARDQLLGREVAVKVQHAHVPDSDRERFLREVRTLARLTHPGVIPVLDLGTDPDAGRPFFTMPLMTGGPVTALGPLEDAPLPLARFLTAAAAASRALHFIHARGITHRDLTPGNVLLDDAWMPRIMDFGLVALTEQTRHLTRSGVTLGTPAYMAPEQARGVGVGPLSDLYALGAVLYRVACGSPPFVGDSDQSVLYQHVYEAAPDPRDLNPAVPDAVARVLLSLLAKAPEDRPPSGEALAHLWALGRRDIWTSHARGQYRGGRTRSGEHPDGPAQVATLREAWSVPLPGEVTWPAAVMGDGDLVAVGPRGFCAGGASAVFFEGPGSVEVRRWPRPVTRVERAEDGFIVVDTNAVSHVGLTEGSARTATTRMEGPVDQLVMVGDQLIVRIGSEVSHLKPSGERTTLFRDVASIGASSSTLLAATLHGSLKTRRGHEGAITEHRLDGVAASAFAANAQIAACGPKQCLVRAEGNVLWVRPGHATQTLSVPEGLCISAACAAGLGFDFLVVLEDAARTLLAAPHAASAELQILADLHASFAGGVSAICWDEPSQEAIVAGASGVGRVRALAPH